MTDPVYLAIDMGAESGRVIAATLSDGALKLEQVNRFANDPRQADGHLRWDLDALWRGISDGLGMAAQRYGDAVRSIAVDTWGVDYGLIKDGELLADPIHYRDPRTEGWPEKANALISDTDWWLRTGVRSMVFNTAYQLLAEDKALLERADRLLTMPDLIAWKLSGLASNEWTNASTTQLCTAGTGNWDRDILSFLDVPDRIFHDTSPSGTVLGPMLPQLAESLGWTAATAPKIVLAAGHDTGSAVAAMPTDSGAYISCGTWSLMGVVSQRPVVEQVARERLLSNELAWDGQTRLLKNIMGLWVVQNCKRGFEREGRSYDYTALTELAAQAKDPSIPLDVDDERFFGPGTDEDPYLDRVRAWYAEQGAPAPEGDGAVVRAVLRGLAQAYRNCMIDLAAATGTAPERIVLIGGGGRNQLLQKFTVQACGVDVLVGSTEATALGNALVQAVACGDLDASALPATAAASSDEPVSVL